MTTRLDLTHTTVVLERVQRTGTGIPCYNTGTSLHTRKGVSVCESVLH